MLLFTDVATPAFDCCEEDEDDDVAIAADVRESLVLERPREFPDPDPAAAAAVAEGEVCREEEVEEAGL